MVNVPAGRRGADRDRPRSDRRPRTGLELLIVGPGLLHELELPRDVAIHANEVQAALETILRPINARGSNEGCTGRTIGAAAAQQTMALVDRHGSFCAASRLERIARVGAAHMRSHRALEAEPVGRRDSRSCSHARVRADRHRVQAPEARRSASGPPSSRPVESQRPDRTCAPEAFARKRQKRCTCCSIWRNTR